MSFRLIAGFLSVASFCFADSLTLKNGGTIQGTYLGGDSRQVKMAVGDRVETYSVDEIASIRFGTSGGSVAAPRPSATNPPTGPEGLRRRTPEAAYNQAPPATGPEIPAGTALVVRLIDPVDSEADRVGQTYRATIDEPVVVDGQTVIPRGADVTAKLVNDQQSGKLEGRTILTLDLMQVQVNGRMVDVATTDVSQQSASRGKRSAVVVGGATALGAIIGAIAGGGKGAAIGATSGAAAGTGAQVLTKGQRVRIPAETRLTFTLQQPLRA